MTEKKISQPLEKVVSKEKKFGLLFKWGRGYYSGDPIWNDNRIEKLEDFERFAVRFDLSKEQVWLWMTPMSALNLYRILEKLLKEKKLLKKLEKL